MQNFIIVNKSIEYIQYILKRVSNTIYNIKLYTFYTEYDVNDILKQINNKKIDIIIMDFNKDGKYILDYLQKNNIDFYKKSIIILYDKLDNIEKLIDKKYMKYIFKCVKISYDSTSLIQTLRRLVYIKETIYDKSILEYRIKRNLYKIGFSKKNIGTQYIVEIIQYLLKNKIEKFKLNEMYLVLSNKYNKSYCSIKGAIQLAKDTMCKCGDKEVLIEYFSYLELEIYPTVKEIIITTMEKL